MSSATQTFRVRFGRAAPPSIRSGAGSGVGMGIVEDEHEVPRRSGVPSRAARFLAMAHRLDELMRAGKLSSYKEAGAWLGVSAARANMISHLALLAPAIQDAVLTGELRASEHELRGLARMPLWEDQIRSLREVIEARSQA